MVTLREGRSRPLVIGLGESLAKVEGVEWREYGTRSHMLLVHKFEEATEPTAIVRYWIFSPEGTETPKGGEIVVKWAGGEVRYAPRLERKGFYVYSEAVLVVCPSGCTIRYPALNVEVELGE